MSHGVQGDSVQVFAIFRDQVELLDGSLETGGLFSNAVFFWLEDRFRRLALIRLEHPNLPPAHGQNPACRLSG